MKQIFITLKLIDVRDRKRQRDVDLYGHFIYLEYNDPDIVSNFPELIKWSSYNFVQPCANISESDIDKDQGIPLDIGIESR